MNLVSRLASGALLLLPGALTVYLSFNAGGLFPDTEAIAALVLSAVLSLRIAFAQAPFAGYGKALAVCAAALGLFALWTLLSGIWSDAPGRALLEFDRALLYLLALLLFGSVPRTTSEMQWMLRGLALAIVAVSVCGLVTRVLPDVWPISATIADNRLSYPLTYWNSLGLLAAVGIILCFHLASSRSESAAARVLGATAVPLLATTLFFTFSRGAIAAGIVGLVVYMAVARPRALVSGLIATVPTAAIAILVAYHADLLATLTPTTAAATDQGHEVALVVGLCAGGAGLIRAILLRFDPRLSLGGWSARVQRPMLAVAAAVLASALIISFAVGLPSSIGHQYDRFVQTGETGNATDLRTRLTDPGNNGRLDEWHVAIRAFRDSPLNGEGAGTFQTVWARNRPIPLTVRDAHSLYLEVLSELGVVGFALLAVALLSILGGLALRARSARRTLYAALFAATLAWMLRAGIDWDWEMPAITLWVFALGGAALAVPMRERAHIAPPSNPVRLGAAVACLALAVVPGLVLISDRQLIASARAFERRDCPAAIDSASSSLAALGVRPEPYEVRGYCRLRSGLTAEAVSDLGRAVDRDPQNWAYHYGLALARAASGLDPRPQARMALQLNPRDAEARDAYRRFATSSRRAWQSQARALLRGAAPTYLSER